ncbi:MAG TPA: permease [Candidatus Dormibacteraeota bacterium]|nr:permease [Candidatus Dormibacteraeota bacterium]
MAFFMFWDVLWPLVLGFLISALVESVVPRAAVVRALGRDGLKGVTFATVLGATSSSCSYAAVAVARSLFRKGATLANAIIFEFASTNLVFELGLVLLFFLGWQFLAAEFAGGLLMVAVLAVIFKYTLRSRLVEAARAQADKGLSGRMEGHAAMQHVFADRLTSVSHNFYMNVASVAQDVALGFLIAGAIAAWVPVGFWQAVFLTHDPALGAFWGPLVAPLIALLSFVCSVGNVPLAAVLWNGGISFGGAITFVFADLVILPILDIYRRYYGWRTALYLLATSYAAMVVAGLAIGAIFAAFGIAPAHRHVTVFETAPSWNYTTFLNLASLVLMAVLGWRFFRTGGLAMLRSMEHAPSPEHEMVHDHHGHHDHNHQ